MNAVDTNEIQIAKLMPEIAPIDGIRVCLLHDRSRQKCSQQIEMTRFGFMQSA